MFKRTKGYLLLTMLVLTGLAGRMHSGTLSNKERRHLVTELKTSRSALLHQIEDLSKKQLAFRTDKNLPSIEDCFARAVSVQSAMWSDVKITLHQTAQDKKRKGDASLEPAFFQYVKQRTPVSTLTKHSGISGSLKVFKMERDEVLRYAKTSTEDVRSHFMRTGPHEIDAYELMLLICYSTEYYTRQIEIIKTSSSFPK